jgi:ABC-type nitrate/sulfonate/bicarbonate transport system ATPase subunit
MITIERLTKKYGSRTLYSNFSYTIKKGKRNILLGPSGCGKSTLISIIAGLDNEWSGSLTGVPEKVGAAFQDERLLPWLSGRENILFTAPHITSSKLKEISRICRIESFLNTRVSKMSGGERQRLSLARSIAGSPELLLLDEPFRSLDISLRHQLTGELGSYLESNSITSLIVTHDIFEALELGEHITVLKGDPISIAMDFDTNRESLTAEELYRVLVSDK